MSNRSLSVDPPWSKTGMIIPILLAIFAIVVVGAIWIKGSHKWFDQELGPARKTILSIESNDLGEIQRIDFLDRDGEKRSLNAKELSVDEIAKQLGCSRRTVFRYFSAARKSEPPSPAVQVFSDLPVNRLPKRFRAQGDG